ncbi:hypothetical protein QEV83_13120 [Methylocapsa sp. D3K7]|uniref:hypothetical protein n=1 Tax=Methylocapsa sp. D3K7 TaxID=3041435 RepID=UPI00244E6F5B|nr:hypothetical protein [Methylocapsa sp. D3K7]WGJ13627.1 hypothetical protein QEV83_13120 [Methylocapsa sp. D3K7]
MSNAAPAIDPIHNAVILKAGTSTTAIPAGSFTAAETDLKGLNRFLFNGIVNGTALNVLIEPTGTQRYAITARVQGTNISGTKNPVPVTLAIGGDCGQALVAAKITP